MARTANPDKPRIDALRVEGKVLVKAIKDGYSAAKKLASINAKLVKFEVAEIPVPEAPAAAAKPVKKAAAAPAKAATKVKAAAVAPAPKLAKGKAAKSVTTAPKKRGRPAKTDAELDFT